MSNPAEVVEREHVMKVVRDIIATHVELGPNEIRPDSPLFELPNVDSLKVVQAALALEAHFAMRFAEDQIIAVRTVAELADLIMASLSGGGR